MKLRRRKKEDGFSLWKIELECNFFDKETDRQTNLSIMSKKLRIFGA